MRPDHLVKNVAPGNNSIDTLDCGTNTLLDDPIPWQSAAHSFAEEYSVKGWFKSEAVCDKVQTVFRFVIDLGAEGKGREGSNPNFANGEFQVNGQELGTNVLVGEILNGKFLVHTYTFGIQEESQDVLVELDIGSINANEWLFVSVAYNFGLKRCRTFIHQHGEDTWETATSHHLIPKYVGFVVGPAYEG